MLKLGDKLNLWKCSSLKNVKNYLIWNLTWNITLIGNRTHMAEEKALGFTKISWRHVLERFPCQEVTISDTSVPMRRLYYQEYRVLRSLYISNECVCAPTMPIYMLTYVSINILCTCIYTIGAHTHIPQQQRPFSVMRLAFFKLPFSTLNLSVPLP